MAFDIAQKRAKLRLAHEVHAPAAGKTLLVWMLGEMARLDVILNDGHDIASTSGNGISVSHFDPRVSGAASNADLLAFWEEMRTLYDVANADLIASGVATPTEAQVVALMLSWLARVTSYTHDFSNAKYDTREVPV